MAQSFVLSRRIGIVTSLDHYINETHVVGWQTRLILITGCMVIQDIRLELTEDRRYCSQVQVFPL